MELYNCNRSADLNPELKMSFEREGKFGEILNGKMEEEVFERVTVDFKSGVRESKRTHINY